MINTSDEIDFSLCEKKDKKLHGNVCCYMGIRDMGGCFCFLDFSICKPYQEYLLKKSKKIKK